MKFLKHISTSMSKLSSTYSNQLVTPIESTKFERICQLSYSLTIFIHLPRSLNYTSNYLNFNIEYKARVLISYRTGRYGRNISHRRLKRYRNVFVSYRFKYRLYRVVPVIPGSKPDFGRKLHTGPK